LYGRPEIDKYKSGLKTCLNFIPLIQGPVERRPGTAYMAEVLTSSKKTRVFRFEFSVTQAYIIEFGDLYFRVFQDNALLVTAPTSIVTTYAEADLFQLKFSQSADVMYITHTGYPPRKIQRTSATVFTIADVVFSDGPFLNTNIETTTLTLSGGTYTKGTTGVTCTASAVTGINGGDGFKTTDVGRLIRIKRHRNNSPETTWTWLTITAFTSTTVVTVTITGPDAAGVGTTDWRLGVWSATTGYPAGVTFHQNRLAFGGGVDTPQRLDLSRSGDFENMAPTETDGTVVDDNAIAITLSADNVNVIRWLADDEKGLIVGTAGGEWVVRPSDTGGVLTPATAQAKRSTAYGSADVAPVRAGRGLLFVQRAKRKLRELAYLFEDDGFRAPDMTVVSEHITATGIVELAYQAEPQSVVWLVLTDGTLLGFTYDREQQITGWHRHTVGGVSDASGTAAKVESVAVIPNTAGDADEVYLVVQRYINGAVVRTVEYMKPYWSSTNDQADAFFVDSGLTYSGASTSTLTGLTHLEGETVSILSEGASHPDKTVASGSVTLDRATTKAQVGLAYTSDFETLRPDFGAKDGTAQGKLARFHRVIFRFFQTLGGTVGPDTSNLDTVVLRKGGGAMDTAVPLFDGDQEFEWDGEYSSDNHIFYRQTQPLPVTIEAVMPQMSTQDR